MLVRKRRLSIEKARQDVGHPVIKVVGRVIVDDPESRGYVDILRLSHMFFMRKLAYLLGRS